MKKLICILLAAATTAGCEKDDPTRYDMSQGRVCFRFLGTGYKKEYFISPEGKAYEEWDQIRDALGSFVYKSRRIETYEEYRDIIFGNGRGLPPEFRKFAITESRQYQNIPRTIQNV